MVLQTLSPKMSTQLDVGTGYQVHMYADTGNKDPINVSALCPTFKPGPKTIVANISIINDTAGKGLCRTFQIWFRLVLIIWYNMAKTVRYYS